MWFLSAIRQHAPAVLNDLAERPLAIYTNLPDLIDTSTWQNLNEAALDWAPELKPLRAAIHDWSQHWNLETNWCRDRALQTLAQWARTDDGHPLRSQWSHEATSYFVPISSDARTLTFFHPGWDPSFGSRADAEKMIREAFDDHLAAYFKDLDALAASHGMERTPEKRTMDHFVWLVRYQILGQSFDRLAKDVFVSRQTATNGVKNAARLIDLPLRKPGKPGRPSKSKQ
jgi:hypothetical protein